MRRMIARSLSTLLISGLAATAAYAGPITGVSITTNGNLRLDGRGDTFGGDAADGLGVGFYSLGNCTNNGINSNCFFTGTYQESTGSLPGDIGTFQLVTTYAGTSPISPSTVKSNGGNPNQVGFNTGNLNGALMTLTLFPGYGGQFSATLPPFGPAGLGFSAFFLVGGSTCSGLPVNTACTVQNTLLTNNAIMSGPIGPAGFFFSIPAGAPNTAPVPEPGTVALLATGLAAAVAQIRRRRR